MQIKPFIMGSGYVSKSKQAPKKIDAKGKKFFLDLFVRWIVTRVLDNILHFPIL